MIFRHLTVDYLKQVTELKLKVGERELKLQPTDDAMRFLIKESSNLKYGTGPLRRSTLEKHVFDHSEALAFCESRDGFEIPST